MAVEIERKFLVNGESWRALVVRSEEILQGYISREKRCHVRVRTKGGKGILTLKGESSGISRTEFEYEVPLSDAKQMINEFCDVNQIAKIRHTLIHKQQEWVIDEFAGENSRLIMAEVELTDQESHVELPPWVGKEVSDDPRFYNAYLSQNPFNHWQSL